MMKLDKDAALLVLKWHLFTLRDWYVCAWYEAIDYLRDASMFLLILLRLILSPILIAYRLFNLKSDYQKVIAGKTSRERLRKKLKNWD